jgi:hypothetical protein
MKASVPPMLSAQNQGWLDPFPRHKSRQLNAEQQAPNPMGRPTAVLLKFCSKITRFELQFLTNMYPVSVHQFRYSPLLFLNHGDTLGISKGLRGSSRYLQFWMSLVLNSCQLSSVRFIWAIC